MAETLVVLVSGRGALTSLAGVPSVQRHVQAGRTLGLDVIVVYPPERRALGAEIRGLVAGAASCIPADQLAEALSGQSFDRSAGGLADRPAGLRALSSDAGTAPDAVLVVAAEWYLSLAVVLGVRDAVALRAFGRVCERGCVSVPVARVSRDDAAAVARQLGTTSAAAALAALPGAGAAWIDLDPRSQQRLSDNVSTAHAEEKLLENLFGPQRVLPVLRLRPTLAPMLARLFSATELGPAGISALKLAVGLAAAWIIGGGSFANGLSGALLYFAARLIGASGIVLARAGFADSGLREKLDLAGDTVLHIALLWSLAGGPARGNGAIVLATIATAGVLISTGVAYVFVLRESWEARRRAAMFPAGSARLKSRRQRGAARTGTTGDDVVVRFVQRDGIAYALLFAAAAGSLDLFLWAAAVASHLFYVLWLLGRPRDADTTMPLGRPA